MRKEIFENQIYKFKSNLESPYIIDCGANIGLSIIYFKQLYPNATVVGFEPDNRIFEVLRHNVHDVFNMIDVSLINKACWNEETTLKFFNQGTDGGRKALGDEQQDLIEVATVRLKSFLNKKMEFLKIDIEGAEVEVLFDIREELQFVRNIFVEFHSFVGKEQKLPEILALLKKVGFRLYISTPCW